jgi:YcaO-like protein with predicted kinase domain
MASLGITRVANITGLDYVGLPVVQVVRPNSRSLAVSQGKGLTLAAAKASGVMESIELHHAEHIDRPLRLATYRDMLDTDRVIDVTAVPKVQGSRFHDHLTMLWIRGHDLMHDEPVWVPYETVNLNTTSPAPTGSGCFAASSNGLASGNHPIEAISHAICEVVERDATSLWQLMSEAAQEDTRVDLDSINDDECIRVLGLFTDAKLRVVIWDLTCDTGLPVFQCLLAEESRSSDRLVYTSVGMGCHPCRPVALCRAMAEAAQSRLTLIAGSRDDVYRSDYELDAARLDYLHRLLELTSAVPGRRHYTDTPTYEGLSLIQDVVTELDCLSRGGIERLIVVDLSKEEIGLPVVRVVAPGLEGFGKGSGYVPGQRALAQMTRFA